MRNEVDDDEIEEEGDLKTTKKKNISSSFRYQSCFTDETHGLLISVGRSNMECCWFEN